jgi:hypothetical protein
LMMLPLIFIKNTYAHTYVIICVTASSSLCWRTQYHIHWCIITVGLRFVTVGGEGTLIMLPTQHSFLLYYWYDTNILVCHAASPRLLLLTYIAGSGDSEAEVRMMSFFIIYPI